MKIMQGNDEHQMGNCEKLFPLIYGKNYFRAQKSDKCLI